MVRVRYSFGSRHTGKLDNISKQRKPFPSIVAEVIRVSDIVLQVLDARFIAETRNLALEDAVLSKGKKMIYVLNKVDLVKRSEVQKLIDFSPYVFISCTKRQGSVKLRGMIKKIARSIELPGNKERVQVGVVGYPNTGKSSLLNFLTGKTSAKTGNQPGFTKGMQKVRLTKDILILDTPGVIADEDYSMHAKDKIAKHTKVGSRSYNNVRDPELVIQSLLDDVSSREKIESYYGIASESDAELFIESLGRAKQFLRKGGSVDVDRTSRLILKDWQDGVITKSK